MCLSCLFAALHVELCGVAIVTWKVDTSGRVLDPDNIKGEHNTETYFLETIPLAKRGEWVLLCFRRQASEGITFSGCPSVWMFGCPSVRPSVMYFCTTPTWSNRLNYNLYKHSNPPAKVFYQRSRSKIQKNVLLTR